MVRNLSFKTDDEFDDKLYSASRKKGLTKSAFIRVELEKILGNEVERKNYGMNNTNVDIKEEIKDNKNNKEVFDNIVNNFIEDKKKEETKEQSNLSSDSQPIITSPELSKIQPKQESSKIDNNPQIANQKSPEDVNMLDSLAINKTNPASYLNYITTNDSRINKVDEKSRHIIRKKVIRVNDEQQAGINERDLEHLLNKKLQEKEFGKSFEEIHKRIQNIDDRVCKDGECTKNEFSNLRKDISKLDQLCEDGKCMKNDISELRKGLEGVTKIISKPTFHCPGCQEKILEVGDSYCRNCKTEINAWDELPDWKPFKLRNKK